MNIQQIAACLMQDEVVAYPTEAVFGLGCNPLSESAVRKLLDLKQRPIEKGLILVALTSTSANLTGAPPCRSADAVRSQFGADFPVLDEEVGQAQNPSEIRDLLTNQLFRQG